MKYIKEFKVRIEDTKPIQIETRHIQQILDVELLFDSATVEMITNEKDPTE